MTLHVLVWVKKIGDYILKEKILCRFACTKAPWICFHCGRAILPNEVHFQFDGDRYCIGCVLYE